MFVDNLGATCDNADLSQKMVSEWTEIFPPLGLALHTTEEHVGLGEALGTELDGREFSSRVTSRRFWMLRQGLTALLRRRRCSGRALERVIGHNTFIGLAFREPCARFTLATVTFLLVLPSSWWLPWNPCVLQNDSCLQGWALAHSFWPRETVAQVGRTLERTRFLRLGPHSARDAALVSAWLEVKSDGHLRPCVYLNQHSEAEDWEQAWI